MAVIKFTFCKIRMLKWFVLLLACIPISSVAFGQNRDKTRIFFVCDCQDPVGILFASSLRDTIANSTRYELGRTADQPRFDGKEGKTYNLVLHIVTVDAGSEGNQGHSTAISATITIADIYWGQFVQVCSETRVTPCAISSLAMTDSVISDLH